MDPISDLIAQNKIPIGQWAKTFADVIVETFGTVLRALSGGLGDALNAIVSGLLWLPPSVLALLIAGLAWHLQRSKALAVGVFLGLMFTLNQGMWKQTVSTLVLVGSAATASMLIGLPLGIWSAHKPRVYRFLQPILDFMQTMPTFVYLIPIMALFGLGAAPGLIVTIIFVIPTAVRMTHLGMTSIPKSIIEAGEAFGATNRQLLWKVELPSALPTIMAGLTQCIMLSLSMVVVAALIGAGGLGTEVVRALNNGPRGIPLGVEAGLAIVVLAIILDRMTRIKSGGKS
jgi:glycine betaine/proline transport system permease protein